MWTKTNESTRVYFLDTTVALKREAADKVKDDQILLHSPATINDSSSSAVKMSVKQNDHT